MRHPTIVCKGLDAYELSGQTQLAAVSLVAQTMQQARAPSPQLRTNAPQHADKVPVVVIKKIRDAILDGAFKPGERLPEVELAEAFKVEKARRPILYETFRQLDDRATRYIPLLIKLFPTPETRPRQHQALIELYRQGKVAEALRAFRRIYLGMTRQVIAHLQERVRVDASEAG